MHTECLFHKCKKREHTEHRTWEAPQRLPAFLMSDNISNKEYPKLNYPRMKSFWPIKPKEGFPMILELGVLPLTVHPRINPE